MNKDDQQIAIAGAFPEVFVRPTGLLGWNYKNSTVGRVLPCINGDPLLTLSAIHEAEEKLDATQCAQFATHLKTIHPHYCIEVLDPRNPTEDREYQEFLIIHATAEQRAEALLKTIGKWVEG